MGFWNGSIIRKHRDYCGDIKNHIAIKAISQLDDSEVDQMDEDLEDGQDLARINEGSGVPYGVQVGWIDGHGGISEATYEFAVWSESELTEELATQKIAEWIEEENARRRAAGEVQIVDEG